MNFNALIQRFDLWGWLWCRVWCLSERTGIPLGRIGTWVFHQMMGRPSKKVEDE